MRLALAPKVAVVEEDTAVAEVDKVVAEEDEGVADEDQRVAVASNHRHSTYITMIIRNDGIFSLIMGMMKLVGSKTNTQLGLLSVYLLKRLKTSVILLEKNIQTIIKIYLKN